MDNNYFDDLIRDSIGDYEASFPPSDWDEMEKSLDTSNALRQKLYIAKGIEILLMAFAIWTVVQFVKTDNLSTISPANVPPKLETPAALPVAPFLQEEGQKEEQALPNIPIIPQRKVEKKKDKETTLNFGARPIAAIQSPVIKSVKAKLLPIRSNNAITGTAPNQALINTSNLEALPILKAQQKQQVLDYKAIATLDYKLLENSTKKLSPLDVIPASSDKSAQQKPKSKFRLTGLMAGNWFRINTSEQVPVAKKQEKISGSVALLADYQISKTLRVESGLAYNVRNQMEYDFESAAYGTTRRVLEVQAKSIEVPVNLKYNFASVGQTDFYAVAGVSNYFIMKVSNDLQEIDYYSGVMLADPSYSNNIRGTESLDVGLSDKGNLNDNHYATINGGLGVERKIGKRFTAFLQGDYKQGVLTAGRHEDTISAMSLSAGVRTAL